MADNVASSVHAGSDGPPLLPEVVESLGFGLAQARAGIIGGGTYFADGAELLLISAVTEAVAQEWDLGAMERGMVVTIVFIGILVGNLISGPLGDSYGRRQLILASFVGIFAFSMTSSATVNLAGLAIVRFLVGASFGIGQPAWNTLGAEVTPAKWRIVMQAISQGFFIIGEVFSCVLLMVDDPKMKHLHWRWLLQMGAIPAAVFSFFCYFFLHQSPSYLACAHRYDEAKAVLESMRHDNGAEGVSVDFKLPTSMNQLPARMRRNSRRLSLQSTSELGQQMRIVFSPSLWLSTLIVIYSCFVLNFLYYGCLYAFPQVLSKSGGMHEGAAMELLIGALWEVPGEALGIIFGLWMPRKLNMKVYLFLTTISVLAFGLGNAHSTTSASVAQTLGYYGIKCFVDIGFVVVYQYSIEIYPTQARTTGSAIAIGSGRLAGIISPLIFELIAEHSHTSVFFYVLVVLCVINFVAIDFLKYETQGMALKDELEEDAEQTAQIVPAGQQNGDLKDEQTEASPLLPGAATPAILPEPFAPR